MAIAAKRAERAIQAEQLQALRIGFLLAAPAVFLVLLALTADRWPAAEYDNGGSLVTWARGLLSIVLLLVSGQFVTVLLVLEHAVGRPGGARYRIRLAGVWVGRLVVTLSVALTVAVNWPGVNTMPHWWSHLDDWMTVSAVGGAAEAVSICTLIVAWLPRRQFDADPEVLAPLSAPPKPYQLQAKAKTESTPHVQALGASGGGIRAAAFVMGGYQAVQDRATPSRDDGTAVPPEPPIFAVSGGSYAAVALAMCRTFRADGLKRQESLPWTEVYKLNSPELERLRRHTRYLFEPPWRMRDGFVSLVMGAAINIIIVGLALRLVAWVSAEFAFTTGIVRVVRDPSGRITDLELASGWSAQDWLMLLSFSLLCALLIFLLTLRAWGSTSAFDAPMESDAPNQQATLQRSKSIKWMDWAARMRSVLLAAGVGWLVLVLGLPVAAVGLVNLATTNRPSQAIAEALDSVGFATRSLCTEAIIEQLHGAAAVASAAAQVSPDERRDVTAGACGVETTVSRTASSGGNADVADDVLLPPNDEAARELAETRRIPGQVAGVTGLLLFVLGLLRRGPPPEAAATESWRSRTRRMMLTWLPLAIMLGIGAYLLLLWTLRFLIYIDPGYLMVAAGLTAAACAAAYLMDANATSLHNYYRGRLSDAFAVGLDEDRRRAKELPSHQVYRFSDLSRPKPELDCRLRVIATLNSKASNQAPSMRGGFPVVFGARDVVLYREERQRIAVPVEHYENFAGAGRVSLMATVAISGAAISPLMGRFDSQMAPYRLLLAIFNIRVGTWVPNPMHTVTDPEQRAPGCDPGRRGRVRNALWLTRKPGLAQVALEAIGQSSANDRWVYLSDGGHLDNTGLVEAVRYCVEQEIGGQVLILDASNDPPGTWSAIGDAIGVIRADLCVDLRRVQVSDEPPWLRIYHGSGIEVLVVKAVRVAEVDAELAGAAQPSVTPDLSDGSASRSPRIGSTGAGAASAQPGQWSKLLPPNVISFQLTHRDFPRSSTSRQKFGDLEFEAYRSLGYACTCASFDVADRARSERQEAALTANAELHARDARMRKMTAQIEQLKREIAEAEALNRQSERDRDNQ